MREVAARCGVSESTVSHVINHTEFLSQGSPAGLKLRDVSVSIR